MFWQVFECENWLRAQHADSFSGICKVGGRDRQSADEFCRTVRCYALFGSYLRMLMQPLPLVRKNMSLSLFQEISFTSNLNCSSALERWVLASMKVTTSSLFPTAMVWPSGLQQMLMFSPTKRYYSESVSQEHLTRNSYFFSSEKIFLFSSSFTLCFIIHRLE